MTSDDEFEKRLAGKLRAYMAEGVGAVDSSTVARRVIGSRQYSRRAAVDAVAALGLAALSVGVLVFAMPRGAPPPGATSGNAAATDTVTLPVDTAEATIGLSERERSDAYWKAVSDFAPTAFRYANLQEITEDAHLIVLGRVTGVQVGTVQPFEPGLGATERPTTFGIVTIDEVLKGTPASTSPGEILVARLALETTQEGDLPSEQVILFLKNYAQMREDEGAPPAMDPADERLYVRPNGYQCVLRLFDGAIEIVDGPSGWEDALGPFPAGLVGDNIDRVLSRIRGFVSAST